MDNPNDRNILVLLLHKEKKSMFDKYRIGKLEKKYPDNKAYQGTLREGLWNRGLLKSIGPNTPRNEDGDWTNIDSDSAKSIRTTLEGEIALKNGLFPSESSQKSLDKRFRYVQIYGIAIAALGGLVTVLSFLYKYVKGFF